MTEISTTYILLTIAYILLIMAGVVWVVYRVIMYLQSERDRDSRLEETSIFDDQFRNYVETLKKQKAQKEVKPPGGTIGP
jgi:hypothetical protein